MADMFNDVVDGLSYALETPGMLFRGLAAGKPGSRYTGRQLLEEYKLADENSGLPADIAGTGLDIFMDPLAMTGAFLAHSKGAKLLRKLLDTRPSVPVVNWRGAQAGLGLRSPLTQAMMGG